MVALLKQKAKITINRKERTKYDVADVFKKRKLNESSLAESQIQPQGPGEQKKEGNQRPKITPTVIEKYDVNMSTKK